MPWAAAALLRDVADAFADSGPLDLGLTSESWVEAIASVDRGMASLAEDSSSKTTLEVKRSLKELQSCFARNEARQELLWKCGYAAFIVLITASLVLFHRDRVATVVWLSLLGLLGATCFAFWRYHPDAPRLASRLELPDRPLSAHVVDAPRREVSSGVRAKLGTYVHPVLIATDRRLILVRAAWERPARSSRRGLRILWELPYTDVRSFSRRSTGGEHPEAVVNVKAADREISHKLSAAGGKALVAILNRRAPAALSKPVPPPSLTGARR